LADFYSPSVDSSTDDVSSLMKSSKLGVGGGLLGEFGLGSGNVLFELDALYLHRSNSYTAASVNFAQTSNWISVPVGLKLRLAHVLAIGGGGYVAYRLGNVSYSAGSDSGGVGFGAGKDNNFEFGVYGSAGLTLPMSSKVGLVLEARVMKGLSNISGDDQYDIHSLDVLGLVGLQFVY
jgi:hypothetical protein